MAIKLRNKQLEVKHQIISGNLEILDRNAEAMIKNGYTLLEIKILVADVYNQVFTVLYIWAWNNAEN